MLIISLSTLHLLKTYAGNMTSISGTMTGHRPMAILTVT